jgi:hypothetical protein
MKTLLTTLLSFIVLSASATVYNSDGTVQNIQAIHNNQAVDGDTIIVPAGTFSWTARLNITKGITIQGATTISGPASNPTINDGTIILDNTPRSGTIGILLAQIPPGKSFRLTGMTFRRGATTSSSTRALTFSSTGSSPNRSMRMDHCHLDRLYTGKLFVTSGWIYGVIDHNVLDCSSGISITIGHNGYGGNLASDPDGNHAWADYSRYGTGDFFFIEDNTVRNVSGTDNILIGGTDTTNGGKDVFRHNYFFNCVIGDHGTEGQAARFHRCREVYNNTFEFNVPNTSNAQRAGSSLYHDNIWLGTLQNANRCATLNSFRSNSARSNSIWGPADGTSPWDLNDDGTGNPAPPGSVGHTFLSGTATGGSVSGGSGTMIDSTKNWTPNQWVGYSVKNKNPQADGYNLGSHITSNTATSLTYSYYGATDTAHHLRFSSGDRYEIHRCIKSLDQAGTGKGDLINSPNGIPINTVTGTACWPHAVVEPCFSWDNRHLPDNVVYGFGTGIPFIVAGRDYFNLGNGFPSNTTPPAVSAALSPAINGTQYSGPFTYPHPLVSGVPPTPTPTPTPTATPSPAVTTNPATNIASFAAALNGSVNPRGSTTTVYFQWGTTTSYGHTTSTQTQTGNTSRPITANISGLSASHLYHFRIVATNGGGTSFGSDRTFTTLSATGPPVVTTNPATNVTTSSARLNGSLDPHGLTTTVYFQWGTTTSYGHTTPMQTQTGNTYRNITANISGLSASHLYHFRIVATNSAGTRMGSDRTFNTP